MNARLVNTNAVASNKKSPIIVVLRDDIKDGEQKKIYIKNDPHEENSDLSDEGSDSSPIRQAEVLYYENENDVVDSGLIWSQKKSTENDGHATEYFLQLRGSEKYKTLFADKRHGKYKLWLEIAEEMNNAGFYVGEGREAAEKCRQKFCNLERNFLKYVRQIRSGNSKREPPFYYDLMYNIVDSDDKLHRQEQHTLTDALRDSVQVDLVSASPKNNIIPSSSRNNENINNSEFCNVTFSSEKHKRTKMNNDIISLLTKQHTEMMKLQRDFLERIDKHLTVQNEQRERMVNNFVEAMKGNSCSCQRKRKHSSSPEIQNTNINVSN